MIPDNPASIGRDALMAGAKELPEAAPLASSVLLNEASTIARSAFTTIKANKAAGDAIRDEIADLLRAAGRRVRTEVDVQTLLGVRRMDIEVRDQAGDLLGYIETKLGKSRSSVPTRKGHIHKEVPRLFYGYSTKTVRLEAIFGRQCFERLY
jgi:hypothetical protein